MGEDLRKGRRGESHEGSESEHVDGPRGELENSMQKRGLHSSLLYLHPNPISRNSASIRHLNRAGNLRGGGVRHKGDEYEKLVERLDLLVCLCGRMIILNDGTDMSLQGTSLGGISSPSPLCKRDEGR